MKYAGDLRDPHGIKGFAGTAKEILVSRQQQFFVARFFNYRHLLLGKVENESGRKWFIGVPGIYQNQEKVLATVFGFPEFRQEKDTGVKTGQFGYWYRFMDE